MKKLDAREFSRGGAAGTATLKEGLHRIVNQRPASASAIRWVSQVQVQESGVA